MEWENKNIAVHIFPGCPVDATRLRLRQAGEPSFLSVMEMESLLQVYAAQVLIFFVFFFFFFEEEEEEEKEATSSS